MFPAGWPGVGLLLLRFAVAGKALAYAINHHEQWAPWAVIGLTGLAVAVGIGILTPLLCILAILVQLALAAGPKDPAIHDTCTAVLVAAALAALGPGAYSFDARRFGRRIVLTPRSDSARP
jgi:hypothetical protein